MKNFSLILGTAFIAPLVLAVAVLAEDQVATMRGADIVTSPRAPRMAPVVNTDQRQVRNYPEQPPIIPHKIDGYQVDTKANKCLTCHSRTAVAVSQAPMISITHFMNRDGQFLASVSPRRYFCTQCHVTQLDVRNLVDNDFLDVDRVLNKPAVQN